MTFGLVGMSRSYSVDSDAVKESLVGLAGRLDRHHRRGISNLFKLALHPTPSNPEVTP
jgi:hypothetical protein